MMVFLLALTLLSEMMMNFDVRIAFGLYFSMVLFFLYSFSKAGALNSDGILASIFIVIPMIRIVQIFVYINIFWNIFIVSICFLYLSVFLIRKYKISPGFNNNKSYYLLVALVIGMMFGVFSNYHFSIYKYSYLIYILPFAIFIEDLYFRGLLQNFIDYKYGKVTAVFFVSAFIFILSLGFGVDIAAYFFLVSLISGVLYADTKNIFVPYLFDLMVYLFYYVFTYSLF
jgi:membrane protease YdiL (CAAX protease family)